MKEEIRDWQMKCRLTQREKAQVLEYCEKHDMTISEFVRYACETIFQKEVKK